MNIIALNQGLSIAMFDTRNHPAYQHICLAGLAFCLRTRALELMMRLLVESEEVRPSLVQSLFDYMKQKLRDAKDADMVP